MAVKTLTINDHLISARESETILEAARDAGIEIPTLCYLEGLSGVGACRFGIHHNRCVLCTRCVRVCDEIEGAHTWDVAGRGHNANSLEFINTASQNREWIF